MVAVQRVFLSYIVLAACLLDCVLGWSLRLPGRKAFRLRRHETAVTQSDSRLFYKNGVEQQDLVYVPSPVIQPTEYLPQKTEKPKAIDLPRHAPPKKVIEQRLMFLDVEMLFGRISMVAAMLLIAGELATGLSVTDQVNGILW